MLQRVCWRGLPVRFQIHRAHANLNSQSFISLLRVVKDEWLAAPVLQHQADLISAFQGNKTYAQRAQRRVARPRNEPASLPGEHLVLRRRTRRTPSGFDDFLIEARAKKFHARIERTSGGIWRRLALRLLHQTKQRLAIFRPPRAAIMPDFIDRLLHLLRRASVGQSRVRVGTSESLPGSGYSSGLPTMWPISWAITSPRTDCPCHLPSSERPCPWSICTVSLGQSGGKSGTKIPRRLV